ncbi:MAG: ABC transporter ATP-binding protein [Candidatus Heimdallarchaeota archaeon]|nr:ABC transporter ATP-binding protein [Candidatus Heimdallarchaeota archaeon]
MSIEIENLYKEYQKKGNKLVALDNISLNIKEGEFIGLLGPNGAGKTTLTKILTTLLLPTAGDAYINDVSIRDDKRIRKMVGAVFGESGGRSLYYRLSVEDNLLFYSTLSGLSKNVAKRRISSLLNYFDLEEKRKTLVMKLSTGMKAKVLLIRALIPFPQVLLLDEPTLGFDAESSEKAKDLLNEFNREFGTTILLTSHNFPEIDELTSRLILIDSGKIVQDCKPNLFKKTAVQEYVHLIFSLPPLPTDGFGMSKLPTEVFKKLVKDSAGADILSLKEKDSFNFVYEATVQPRQFPLNETISRITVLILRASGEIFKIAPSMPSLKESFLAFLALNKQETLEREEKSIDEIFTFPIQEEDV